MGDTGDLGRALARLEAGELAAAESICNGVLSDAVQRPDALHILGLVAHRRGGGVAALSFLKDAVKADPRNGDRRLDLGMLAYEVGAYYDAVAHLEALLAGCGEVPQALCYLGNALAKLGHPEEAASRLERAVAADPTWPEAWVDLAGAYLQMDKPMSAVSALEGAYRLRPDAGTLILLGEALQQAGALHRALRAYKTAMRKEQDNPEARRRYGTLLMAMGKHQRGLKVLREASERSPDDAALAEALAEAERTVAEGGDESGTGRHSEVTGPGDDGDAHPPAEAAQRAVGDG